MGNTAQGLSAYIIKLVIFLVYYSLISMFTLHIAVYYYNI